MIVVGLLSVSIPAWKSTSREDAEFSQPITASIGREAIFGTIGLLVSASVSE